MRILIRFSKTTLHNIYQTEFHASKQTGITKDACAEREDIACPTLHTQSHYKQLDMTADDHGNDTSLVILQNVKEPKHAFVLVWS